MSIFLDFDGTVTAEDTIGKLASFALQFQGHKYGRNLCQEWDEISELYCRDYNKYVASYELEENTRLLPAQEFEFLRGLRPGELQSLERIKAAGIFKGITPEDFRQGGRDLVKAEGIMLRPGFRRFVEERLKDGWKVWIISVNWSTAWIDGVCDVPGINIIANDVQPDGAVAGPEVLNRAAGAEIRKLTNSADKVDAMEAILARESPRLDPSFYFGDSATDLECLLAATHGVVISDNENSSLLKVLRRIGNDIPHATKLEANQDLCWASSYDDVIDNVDFSLNNSRRRVL